MKEFKKSQFGWNVVEHYPEQKVYSIKEKDNVTYLIPEEIWDALSSATNRADNYRKSRNYFESSRDLEVKRGADMMKLMNDNFNAKLQHMDGEITFLINELQESQDECRMYKGANLALVVTVAIMSFYIFIF